MKPVRLVHLILMGPVVCVVLAMLVGVPEHLGRAYAWVSRAQGAQDVAPKGEPPAKSMYDRPKVPSKPGGELPVEARASGRSSGAREILKTAPIPGERPPEDYRPPSKDALLSDPPATGWPSAKDRAGDLSAPPSQPPLSPPKPTPRPPTLDELVREARQVEKEQREIMAGYDAARDATAPPEARASFREKLTNVLERQFDIQQQQRELEISQIEARIRRLREMLEKRNQGRQKIVQERLNQLLREADGLGWIAPGEPGRAGGMGDAIQEGLREEMVTMPDGSRVRQLIPEYRPALQPVPEPTPTPFDPTSLPKGTPPSRAAPSSVPAREALPAVPSIPESSKPFEKTLPLPSAPR